MEPAKHPAASDIHGKTKTSVATALRAGLIDGSQTLHRIGDGSALGDGQRNRLFAIDVLACLCGFDGNNGVPVVGRRNQHSVDVIADENFAEVIVRGTVSVAIRRIDRFLCLGPVVGIDVADRQQAKVLAGKEISQVVHALAA
jgi:hypothetical protein